MQVVLFLSPAILLVIDVDTAKHTIISVASLFHIIYA